MIVDLSRPLQFKALSTGPWVDVEAIIWRPAGLEFKGADGRSRWVHYGHMRECQYVRNAPPEQG